MYHKETVPKYEVEKEVKNENINELNNKPTISKSPTFGHLHAPEVFKGEPINTEHMMVESLADRINDLPISPINYHSSQ